MSAQTDIKTSAGSSTSTADSQSIKGDSAVLTVLKELGTILTSGAIIGALGKVIGATDTQVAIWTLSVTALVFIFIYRTVIQQKLKSDRILIIILAISIVCTFFVGNFSTFFLNRTISKATGIIEYQARANDFLPRLREFITDAKEEVWVTGISFYITLPANREILLKRIEEGLVVKFLIYNPLSANLEEVAKGFGQTKEELLSECKVTIENLRSIVNEVTERKLKGTLEVKLFSTIPKARIYVFDRRREDGYTYFIPHIDQQNSPNLPGFLVKNIKSGIAPSYFEGIERLWNSSTEFAKFLEQYASSK